MYCTITKKQVLAAVAVAPVPALVLARAAEERDAARRILTFMLPRAAKRAVRDLFSSLLEKSTLLFSVASCQCISNVPSAILLSQFTDNYADLLVGVNIGGVGTLISSLASLITFREYVSHNPGKTGYYIKMFSLFNFAFLIILTGFMILIKLL